MGAVIARQIADYLVDDAIEKSWNGSWCGYFNKIQQKFPGWEPSEVNLDAVETAMGEREEVVELSERMTDCIDFTLGLDYLKNPHDTEQ